MTDRISQYDACDMKSVHLCSPFEVGSKTFPKFMNCEDQRVHRMRIEFIVSHESTKIIFASTQSRFTLYQTINAKSIYSCIHVAASYS